MEVSGLGHRLRGHGVKVMPGISGSVTTLQFVAENLGKIQQLTNCSLSRILW